MSFYYNKLWKLLIDKNMNKTQFRDVVGISNGSLSKLSKNKPVSMETLSKICKKLNCDIKDIVEYSDNELNESSGIDAVTKKNK